MTKRDDEKMPERKEELREELKGLSMRAMISTLEKTHPRTGWNLLVRVHQNSGIRVREFLSYNNARAEQEKVIKNDRPLWTAVVRDKKSRGNAPSRGN